MSYEGMNAKELGASIYRRGLSIETNPFRDGTEEARDFAKGWKREHKAVSGAAIKAYKASKRTMRNEINS